MDIELSFFEIKKEELNKIVEIYPSGVDYTLILNDTCYCTLSPSGKTIYLLSKNDILIQKFIVSKTIFGLRR